jgi:hypothetical protein
MRGSGNLMNVGGNLKNVSGIWMNSAASDWPLHLLASP